MSKESLFDNFGGYYSVKLGGVEYARFAPSQIWTEYCKSMKSDPSFSYTFVTKEN